MDPDALATAQPPTSPEAGFTLIEVMMAGLVALVIVGGLYGLVHSVANTNRETEYERLEIDSVRDARSELMRDIRFAAAVYPDDAIDDREIVLWLDNDDSGGTPGADEIVTWRIQNSGRLTRTVDGTLTSTRAEGIVPDASSFSYSAADATVTVVLVVDLDPGSVDPSRQEFIGTVTVRNVAGAS